MEWFDNPIGQLFGVPSFWISRLAKFIQFLSSTVILIDIIGHDRIENLSIKIQKRLERVISYELPRHIWDAPIEFARDYFLSSIYSLKGDLAKGEKKKKLRQLEKEYENRVQESRYIGIMSILFMFLWYFSVKAIFFPKGISAAWKEIIAIETTTLVYLITGTFAIAVILLLGILCILVLLAIFPIIALFIKGLAICVEAVVDRFLGIIIRLLENKPLSDTILVISFLLLIIGFVLEMIVT